MPFEEWWKEYRKLRLREDRSAILSERQARDAWESGYAAGCKATSQEILNGFNQSIHEAWPEEIEGEHR